MLAPAAETDPPVLQEFGTCYLLSVLQCQSILLSEFCPPQAVVQAYDMKAGVFACRFWHLGEWRIVLVDDYVPCRKSAKQPGMIYAIGSECQDGTSIFLPIVEKAYGKLMGYACRTWGGLARYAAVDVLGGACAAVKNLQAPEASLMPMVLKMEVGTTPSHLADAMANDAAVVDGMLFLSFYFEGRGCLIGSYLERVTASTAEVSSAAVFTGAGIYTLDEQELGRGEVELVLHSVQREASRGTVRVGLQQLIAWKNKRDPYAQDAGNTEIEPVSTSEVCGVILDWIVNSGEAAWLPWAEEELITPEDHDTEPLQSMSSLTGGLILLADIKEGLFDIPGALLRWWNGGEHPGRVWSTREARWVVLDRDEYSEGPEAFEILLQTVQRIETALREDITIKATAETEDGRTLLSGRCLRNCGIAWCNGHSLVTTDSAWTAQQALEDSVHTTHARPFAGLVHQMQQMAFHPESGTGAVMTCSISPPDGMDVAFEERRDDGLLYLHEYAILQLVEPTAESRSFLKETLIQVRNPHGHGEFNGRYSDCDTERMTEELRRNLKYGIADDGSFYMAFSDFQATFSRMDLCLSFATTNSDESWYRSQRQGEIRRSVCGTATEGWAHNPRYHFQLESMGTVVISLTQPDTKFIDGHHSYPVAIGFRLVAEIQTGKREQLISAPIPHHRIMPGANEVQKHTLVRIADSELAVVLAYHPAVASRQVSMTLNLDVTMLNGDSEADVSYAIVPCVEWPDDEEAERHVTSLPFFVEVYSDHACTLEKSQNGICGDFHHDCDPISKDSVRTWFQEGELESSEPLCCDCCGEVIFSDEVSAWCDVCEIDLCERSACGMAPSRDFAEHEPACKHRLMWYDDDTKSDDDAEREPEYCDVCGEDLHPDEVYSCGVCDIRVCEVCSESCPLVFSDDDEPCRHELTRAVEVDAERGDRLTGAQGDYGEGQVRA